MTAVHGTDSALVFDIAKRLGISVAGQDIFVDFNRTPEDPRPHQENEWFLEAGDPFLSGNKLLRIVVDTLGDLRCVNASVRRVIIGDFRALRTFWNPEGIRRAVGVLIAILRRLGIPAVLFETTAGPSTSAKHEIWADGIPVQFAADAEEPAIVDFADVVIEVSTALRKNLAFVTDVRGGRRHRWSIEPLNSKGS
jgi:hypothetical protein